ncbi:MAG: hypothetical protein MK066_14130, partial [Crocinitomicaceae bacterium]|nr:hypothetical protein [Crocinitomicaceae bacterium]
MKKAVFILLLTMATVSLSQNQQGQPIIEYQTGDSINQVYQETMDDVFENVDLSLVESGILYDRGFPFIDIEVFNGELNDSTKSNLLSFQMAYASIYSMIVTQENVLPDPSHYRSLMDSISAESSVIPIALMHQEYHKMDSTSIDSGAFIFNQGKLFDVFPRMDPYKKKNLFISAPAVQYTNNEEVKFVLDSNLFFSNSEEALIAIEIDIDDGNGFIPVEFGQEITLSSQVESIKHIIIRFTTINGLYFNSHFDFGFMGFASGIPGDKFPDIIHYVPGDSADNFNGIGAGNAYVYLGCGHERIEKPYIWAEGFNPNIGKLGSLSLTIGHAVERMNHHFARKDETSDKTLWDELIENGYDIILLDYENGGDYLPRTANFIKEVLEWVNNEKSMANSSEKNVIVGQSMGGVATNLALKEMELEGTVDHEVGTFVVFDSPIMGVNVPIAAQAALVDIAHLPIEKAYAPGEYTRLREFVEILDDGIKLLYTPAARTMIRFLVDNPYEEGDDPLWEDHYHYQHQILGGMPEQCEVIAIANGSIKGSGGKHNFDAGELIFGASGSSLTVIDVLNGLAQPEASVSTFDAIHTTGIVASHSTIVQIITGSSVSADIELRSTAHFAPIFNYTSSFEISTLWGLAYIYSTGAVFSNNLPPIDNAPGGFVGHKDEPLIIDGLPFGVYENKLQTFCFTPTVSVLNFHGPYTDNRWHEPNRDFLDVTSEIDLGNVEGIDNYMANSMELDYDDDGVFQNTAHTWFTYENTRYMLYHLVGSNTLEDLDILDSPFSYNFGKEAVSSTDLFETSSPRMTKPFIGHSISIRFGSTLGVNTNFDLGFTPINIFNADIYGQSPENSHFTVSIGNECATIEPVVVEVDDGGFLTIGDGNLRTGKLIVTETHSILVKDGGTLLLNENSVLQMRSGSFLTVEDGGKVI